MTMTLYELSKTLPNGFHDALLESISRDFTKATTQLKIIIDVAARGAIEPVYRTVLVYLSSLSGFICDFPMAFGQLSSDPLGVSGFCTTEKQLSNINSLSEESRKTVYSFFVEDWNGFIHLAAQKAELTWVE